ncbi:C45 family autoproteolytic acyltransferase/hydolase [Occallatibacter savannae]|uniref:C45 family autoproteolytic acyltransferase/hydolase n=1 Tax=Occallatibacter savannae TaxID=1002691 RepID=UPI000D68F668|nr:C45 family peptidase [Occallatibacter savannae]
MSRRIPRALLLFLLFFSIAAISPAKRVTPAAAQGPNTSRAGYRFDRGGWMFVHLEGSPSEIGFQHGQLLSTEILDLLHVMKVETLHDTKRDWAFYRETSRTMLWPHIDAEYQQELQGIAKGAQSKGAKLDVWDIVALNASIELPSYYVPWLNKHEHSASAPRILPEGHCSAFIATGSYTKGGKIVAAHNNWSSYADGERWIVMFDIKPEHGHHMIMDGEPGVITSQDDFGETDAGLIITETTITQFVGWNAEGKPEFVRSRKAMQYANSIDDYIAIIKEGNNGGYANDWLIGDRNTGEIAYLELGLKNTPVWRTKDGYFISSNFPRDPALIKDETSGFKTDDLSSSMNARRLTWEHKIAANKGQLDVNMAEAFLGNHEDSFTGKTAPSSRTLCGHIDADRKGVPEWGDAPYYPDGAVTGKVTDSDLAANMSLIARAGHPCGEDFIAGPFLAKHTEFSYLKPILHDMKAGPWSQFTADQKQ